MKEWNSEDDN